MYYYDYYYYYYSYLTSICSDNCHGINYFLRKITITSLSRLSLGFQKNFDSFVRNRYNQSYGMQLCKGTYISEPYFCEIVRGREPP